MTLDAGEMSTVFPGHVFLLAKDHWYPVNGRMGGHRGRFLHFREEKKSFCRESNFGSSRSYPSYQNESIRWKKLKKTVALEVSIWHSSSSVLIPISVHNVARNFRIVQCVVNGVYGDLLGRWHFSSDRVQQHSS
jgi:hypothetical protein